MARMVRKQIYIAPEQEEILRRRSKELEISEAEVVRRAIEFAGAVLPSHREHDAWQEELEFISKRRKIPAAGHARFWTREELHEERLTKISRGH